MEAGRGGQVRGREPETGDRVTDEENDGPRVPTDWAAG